MDQRDVDRFVNESGLRGGPDSYREAFQEALLRAELQASELPKRICVWILGKENRAMALPSFLLEESGCIVLSQEAMEEIPQEERVSSFAHEIAALHLNWTHHRFPLLAPSESCLIPHDNATINALVDNWLNR